MAKGAVEREDEAPEEVFEDVAVEDGWCAAWFGVGG